jgi:hypothetical protein
MSKGTAMNNEGPKHLYTIRYKLKKYKIQSFLDELEGMRDTMIEEAVQRSEYKQAKEVIDHIRSL